MAWEGGYCEPEPEPSPYPQLTDEDLERFNWYIIMDSLFVGNRLILCRTITMEKPTENNSPPSILS